MLPRTHRLRKIGDFAQLRQQARSMRGSSVLLRYLIRSHRDPARAGVIIAKKTFKKAVVRNAIRRKLQAILSDTLPLMPLGTLLLLIVGKNAQTLKSQVLRSELSTLLRQARLLPPPSKK